MSVEQQLFDRAIEDAMNNLEGNSADNASLTFEDGIAQLEEIVNRLEQKDIPLDIALQIFSDGVKLVKYCSHLLDDAEKRMEILLEGPDGELKVERASLAVEG